MAFLAYGYDLGGSEDRWRLAETDEYGTLTVDWANSVDDLDELLEEFDRQLNADDTPDVKITMYGHREDTSYMLTAKVIDADWESPPVALDPATLSRREDLDVWDRQLRAALETLGLTPFQQQPRWMLQSFIT